MRRLTEGWFSFAGIRCDSMGLRLLEMPERKKAQAAGSHLTAAGRDGDVWDGDDAYDAWNMIVRCETTDDYDDIAARAWLDGPGELVFSDAPGLAYDAAVVDTVDFVPKTTLFDTQTVTLPFHVQPLRRMIPEALPFTVTNGQMFTNPGSARSLPRITIVGSGEFSVTIGQQTMFFHDVEDGVIIDSKLGDALTLDSALLANDNVSGALFKIQPGTNIVSWLPGLSGSVSSVTIEPRWRCL